MRYKRRVNAYRPAKKRLRDWKEIYSHPKEKELKVQTARSVSYFVVIIIRGLRNTNLVFRCQSLFREYIGNRAVLVSPISFKLFSVKI